MRNEKIEKVAEITAFILGTIKHIVEIGVGYDSDQGFYRVYEKCEYTSDKWIETDTMSELKTDAIQAISDEWGFGWELTWNI